MAILTFFSLLCINNIYIYISIKRNVTQLNMTKLYLKKFQPVVKYYFLMDILSFKYFENYTISFNFGYLIVRLSGGIKTL